MVQVAQNGTMHVVDDLRCRYVLDATTTTGEASQAQRLPRYGMPIKEVMVMNISVD